MFWISLGRTWILVNNQISGIEIDLMSCKGSQCIRALKLLEVDMGRQEHLSSFGLEGVTLPPFGLRCRCFNWCNSHQLTLVIGETPKLKKISFGSTKIHKLIHLLLIKCYHMLPVEFMNSGPFLPFHSLYHSHRHLTCHDCQLQRPRPQTLPWRSLPPPTRPPKQRYRPAPARMGTSMVSWSQFSNKNHHITDCKISFFFCLKIPGLVYVIHIPPSNNWLRIAPPPNIAVLQSYFSIS